ncbi:MAG: adenylosuccinate lyase [Candidatus Infernicultor aquiphilus]|uniref:Adenylosuccinate lyase n=1 Tax=Candidatus Infernicultor aquiphilus TaxID=1805029 RepID=A0A1J5GQK9_9BACT|nr:adenylosuccinate lyase [bacterium]OIP69272.1 MAG: adenylosuccinate lyase [Candidatus Atribacteria bacterium CG2_30_33_13]PIU25644.1 MAG: adenylosuccinate lyase [Candidatus Atribacteria bacterium CG08_land_8_20_14_0_20_33_29]PIW11519.1 MAG: adenylosuccinate lyase [Candidatus Atribacteria bacterium CG17_big_fil_post_rev_8_21_14_2_50_34_11]PIX34027.1 MAG: adenylosuccinate lyase [Candidatus Atribacteria bacterium CG_4_8_14_3_um_filter_34_18]PIY31881.1 MAG: adenylosuccinate lyase [Candidatus Atr
MIDRYALPAMKNIWQEENKYKIWLEIELLACEALFQLKKINKDAIENIKKNAHYSLTRIQEIEKITQHDVLAFTTAVGENLGKYSRYFHQGLTSSDILDTSLALELKQSAEIIIEDIERLIRVLKEKALEHKYTLMVGRTHGVHAEPITLGFKFALWFSEMQRNLERIKRAKEEISYGKISGAVGTFAHLDPYVEEYVCKELSLKPAKISNQIIQRDRHAYYMTTLALVASSLEKIATEIRSLQRTEIYEVEEKFAIGQKGSSAMPHKRNPIICERVCGLSRVVRANAITAMENVNLWNERDISHSSAERIIIPDSNMLIDYMLQKFTNLITNLNIYPEHMKQNLEKTKGLIFSQKIMLELTKRGLSREEAYKIVQNISMQVWQGQADFKALLLENAEVGQYLTKSEIEECFDYQTYLRNIDLIFTRVFGQS